MTRVPFRRMITFREVARAARGTVLLLLFMFICDTAYRYATLDPPDLRYAAPLLPLVLGLGVLAVLRTQWLEVSPESTVLVQQRTFRTLRMDLRTARRAELHGTQGFAQIEVQTGGGKVDGRRRRRRKAVTNLMVVTAQAERSQPPEVLLALADGLDRSRATYAKRTAQVLRAQAAHLEAGGDLLTSPLAEHSRGFSPDLDPEADVPARGEPR